MLLKNWISKLDSEKRKTTWSDYAEINTYKNNEKNEKFSIVENFQINLNQIYYLILGVIQEIIVWQV